jgi:hypothetical protein
MSDAPAGPNAVSNAWFKENLGKMVSIWIDQNGKQWCIATGMLMQWDSYALKLQDRNNKEVLMIKKPGMQFYSEEKEKSQ